MRPQDRRPKILKSMVNNHRPTQHKIGPKTTWKGVSSVIGQIIGGSGGSSVTTAIAKKGPNSLVKRGPTKIARKPERGLVKYLASEVISEKPSILSKVLKGLLFGSAAAGGLAGAGAYYMSKRAPKSVLEKVLETAAKNKGALAAGGAAAGGLGGLAALTAYMHNKSN